MPPPPTTQGRGRGDQPGRRGSRHGRRRNPHLRTTESRTRQPDGATEESTPSRATEGTGTLTLKGGGEEEVDGDGPGAHATAAAAAAAAACIVGEEKRGARGSWQETGEDSGRVEPWRGALLVVARGDWRACSAFFSSLSLSLIC